MKCNFFCCHINFNDGEIFSTICSVTDHSISQLEIWEAIGDENGASLKKIYFLQKFFLKQFFDNVFSSMKLYNKEEKERKIKEKQSFYIFNG